ncbi:MAG: HAMP domain-containing protein, partial [Chloroflexi bacterium]|nr:HAMP domain-containing protein [Chloroflexota bacterium]
MSLHWRIMGSTVFVVVLTVLTSVAVGYYATQARLDVFVDQIGDDEAVQLARNLSREYTAAGGWETVNGTLTEAGYIYDGVSTNERHGESEGGGESSEPFHQERIRVVITGVDGLVVKDNLSNLLPGTAASNLDGRRETVFDLTADEPVGYVYVDVNREFLSNESHGFLNTLLYITLIGGALTTGVAILLAAWLSKRITAPVTALTEATQGIAQGDTTHLPVTSSDELGKMSAAFNRMASDLETQRELRRRLINDVSHELNTPLSVIQLEAQGLSDGLQTAESASDHIVQEVGRLRGLVTDLNSLAETDYGEMRLTLERSSILELLAAEVRRWRPQSQDLQIEISLQTAEQLPDVDLDRMRMSQALGNVISNALRSTESGGNIAINAVMEGADVLAITIVDDGIGIDAADLPH